VPRSSRRAKSKKRKAAKPKGSPQSRLELPQSRKVLSLAIKFCLGTLAVIGSAVGIYSYVSPRVTVGSSALLEPTKPFSAYFAITNNGNFSVHHVRYRCVILNAQDDVNTRIIVAPYGAEPIDLRIPDINPSETSSVLCPFPFAFDHPVIIADVIIYVRYKPDWIPWYQEKPFRFAVAKNSNGQLTWLPRAVSEN